jgi:hypothetical protein
MRKNLGISQGVGLLVVLLLIAAFGVYYYYSGQQDKRLADQVYNQMLTIDGQLDSLKESAQIIIAHKTLNDQIINIVKQIAPDTYMAYQGQLSSLVSQIDYNPVTRAKFESAITLLNSVSTNPKQIKRNRKLLNVAARELKYQHNQEVTAFNQQIASITSQVSDIRTEISHIHGDKLQKLELAKLNFISKKLKETAHSLASAFYASLVDDVLDTVVADSAAESN